MIARSLGHPLAAARIATPTGEMLCVTGPDGQLKALEWIERHDRLAALELRYGTIGESPAPPAIEAALAAYFAGDLGALASVEVDAAGTPFQREAWAALRRIPPGETRSYTEQAAAIGRPNAVRAVGAANGANPAAIVVPCHRVIGADGALTGFGGGMERKRWLLAHERSALAAAQPTLF